MLRMTNDNLHLLKVSVYFSNVFLSYLFELRSIGLRLKEV